MNTYRITFSKNWKSQTVNIEATSRKYAEGQVKNKNKGAFIERCVKVGCKPVPTLSLDVIDDRKREEEFFALAEFNNRLY